MTRIAIKKTVSAICAAGMTLLASTAFARISAPKKAEIDGLEWTYVVEDGSYAIIKSVVTANGGPKQQIRGAVSVPAAFEGGRIPVAGLGFRAFYNQALVPEVVIPEGVRSIGDECFQRCQRLDAVKMPASMRTIGKNSFNGCSGLKSLSLNEGLESIGSYAFYKCTSLRSVDLPSTLTAIKESAFADSGLERIAVPDKVRELGRNAFSNCGYLKTAILGKEIVVLPFRAFYSCENLASVAFPDGALDTIGDECFQRCQRLDAVKMPASMRTIGKNSFNGCSGLKSLSLNEGLESIGSYAFYKCTSLGSVVLPRTLVRINESAFSNSGIQKIAIPDEVREIGRNAFSMCHSLEAAAIGGKVVVLPFRAFYNCKNLAVVAVVDGDLDTIGDECFSGCAKLASLKISKPLQDIKVGKDAFRGTPLGPQAPRRGAR